MDYTELHQHESHDGKARLSRRSWWSRGSTWTLSQRQSRSMFDEEKKQNRILRPTAGRFSRRWIAEALKNAKEDVKTAQWKIILWPICCHLSALSAIIGILAGLLVLATGTVFNLNCACTPDGAFGAGYESYNIWSISGIFQITLGFGELPFSTVKIIDVLWDVVSRNLALILLFLLIDPVCWAGRPSSPCISLISSLHKGLNEIDGTRTSVLRYLRSNHPPAWVINGLDETSPRLHIQQGSSR